MDLKSLDIKSLKALHQLYRAELGAAVQQKKNKQERSRLKDILLEIKQYIQEKHTQYKCGNSAIANRQSVIVHRQW